MNDVMLNKGAIVERCLRRIREEHAMCPSLDNLTHLDALLLNLERACQAAIDMAMYRVSQDHLGVPQSSAQAFDLLQAAKLIDADMARALRAMVGFRNIAVHEYQTLDMTVLDYIIDNGLTDLVAFCRAMGVRIKG